MSVKTSTFSLESRDGLSLFGRSWQPNDAPLAALAIVHGLGEHSERYNHVGGYFAKRGYAVFAADLRGHGRSQGKRGHINHFDEYLDDAQALLDYAHAQTPDLPLFLLGHSMGGLIALTCALKRPQNLAAVIASGPGLRTRMKVPAWKTTLGNLMSSVFPSLSMPNGIDPNHISHDPEIVSAYISDPLNHNKVTARWYTEFTNAGEWALQNAGKLGIPALILQGGGDPIVDPGGAKAFFDRINHSHKKHIEYPGLYHEILNEPEKLQVMDDIQTWLASV
jgi:alpha-beta hydrolase superfamily lysophospholipase